MDGGFFKGVSAAQDIRFKDKQKKLMKTMKFSAGLDRKIDMNKVKLEALKPWIHKRVTELLEMDDDVVVEFVVSQLEAGRYPDGKELQINITGFLFGPKSRLFAGELWDMLDSAQNSPDGVPQLLIQQAVAKATNDAQETDRLAELVRQRDALVRQQIAAKTGVKVEPIPVTSANPAKGAQQSTSLGQIIVPPPAPEGKPLVKKSRFSSRSPSREKEANPNTDVSKKEDQIDKTKDNEVNKTSANEVDETTGRPFGVLPNDPDLLPPTVDRSKRKRYRHRNGEDDEDVKAFSRHRSTSRSRSRSKSTERHSRRGNRRSREREASRERRRLEREERHRKRKIEDEERSRARRRPDLESSDSDDTGPRLKSTIVVKGVLKFESSGAPKNKSSTDKSQSATNGEARERVAAVDRHKSLTSSSASSNSDSSDNESSEWASNPDDVDVPPKRGGGGGSNEDEEAAIEEKLLRKKALSSLLKKKEDEESSEDITG